MRAQVTAFIILGVVALFLVIAFFWYLPSLKQEQAKLQADEIRELPKDVRPIVTYVEACIDSAAKEGLRLLGGQGGYLYEAQGGPKSDYVVAQEGKFFITYHQLRVPYRIQKSIGGPGCAITLPTYPTINRCYPYPGTYPSCTLANPNYVENGCFGRRIPLDVEKATAQLETYIISQLQQTCKFDSFTAFTITASAPFVNITSTPTRTTYTVTYPLELINKNTKARAQLTTFTLSHAFGFDSLYDYVNTLTHADVSNSTFDIAGVDDSNFGVSVITNQFGTDDIISVISPGLKINGEPFTFTFARRNRPPALDFVAFATASLAENEAVDAAGLAQNALYATDPDEDTINITTSLGATVIAHTMLYPNGSRESFDYGYVLSDTEIDPSTHQVTVTIAATDGQFTDFQRTEVGAQP